MNLRRHPTSESSEKNLRIYNFLRSHPVGVLCSVDPNNEPHGSAVYYSVDSSFKLMFTTKTKTKKTSNLQTNNHVMLMVYDQKEQVTVQVTAIAEAIEKDDDISKSMRNTITASMETSDAGIPPIAKLSAGEFTAFRLHPVQIRMAVYERPDPGGYDELFETIDF